MDQLAKQTDRAAIKAAIQAAMPNAIAMSPSAPDTATNNVYHLALRVNRNRGTRWILNLYQDNWEPYYLTLRDLAALNYDIIINAANGKTTVVNKR